MTSSADPEKLPVDSAQAPSARWLSRLRAPAAHPVASVTLIFLGTRLALGLVAYIAMNVISGDPFSVSSLVCRFDCGWYLSIASEGYSSASHWQPGATNYAFFPLLPVAMQIVSSVTGLGELNAGLLVVNVSFLAALIYVYYYCRLLRLEHGTALLAVALLSLAPQGFIFAVPYSESLFVLLLAAAMYHTAKEQYLAAGIAAALLSAVRPNGILFVVFPIAVVLRRHGIRAFVRPWIRPTMFVPIVMAPLGLFAFWIFSYATVGDAFAHVTSSSHGWGWGSGFPPANLIAFAAGNTLSRYWLVATLVAFAASLLLLRYRMYEEFALTSAMFLLFWTAEVPWSMLRLAIVLFPIWIAVSRWLVNRPVATALACSLMGVVNGMLIVAWILQSPIAT